MNSYFNNTAQTNDLMQIVMDNHSKEEPVQEQSSLKEYLSVKDIQTMFKISRSSAYSLLTTKGVPYIRIGRKYVVEKNDFYKFIDEHKGSQIFLSE